MCEMMSVVSIVGMYAEDWEKVTGGRLDRFNDLVEEAGTDVSEQR